MTKVTNIEEARKKREEREMKEFMDCYSSCCVECDLLINEICSKW